MPDQAKAVVDGFGTSAQLARRLLDAQGAAGLADALRAAIDSGELTPGALLPSVRTLSRVTLQ